MSENNEFESDHVLSEEEAASTRVARQEGFDATRRASERAVVSYLGIVMVSENDMTQVDLVDLSAQGARMVTDASFNPDGEFVLKVPETGARFVSEVAWQKDRTFGVRFLRPCKD